MRKHYFRPSFGDSQCGSFRLGHHVDAGQYFMSVTQSSLVIPVIAVVQGDGVVRLDWDGSSSQHWNHRPEIVEVALRRSSGVAEWRPERHVLIVPPQCLPMSTTCLTSPCWTSGPSALVAHSHRLEVPAWRRSAPP